MKRFITILTIVISFCSCVKDEELKLSAVSDKIVVHSYISPSDTIIAVRVATSFPIDRNENLFDNNQYVMKDAYVEMSNAQNTIVLQYNFDRFRYEVPAEQLQIIPGITYYLFVRTSDGREVRSECTVPKAIEAFSYQEEPYEDQYEGGYYGNNTLLTMQWKSETASYFMFGQTIDCSGQEEYCDTNVYTYPFTAYKEGDLYKSKERIYKQQSIKNIIVIDAIEKNYEQYYKWRENAEFQNPFSQPVVTFTNIENGLGVFGAITRSFFEIE